MTAIAIIGSGITGLACARRLLENGLQPILLDKGRGIGGRIATRRSDGGQFDHGAQYVTAQGAGFAAVLDQLAQTGAVASWQDGSGRSRIVGTTGMSSLAKALGQGLDIRQGVQVTAVRPTGTGWMLRIGAEEQHATHVVVTVPAPQVSDLLGPDHPLVGMLAKVRMEPCLTLMAALTGPAPFITRRDADDPLAWIAQDSSKPGRPQGDTTTWVAQAGAGFSAMHLDQEPGAITAMMLPMLCDRLGATADRVKHADTHRWRYARVSAPLGEPFLRTEDRTLYLGGDWCLGPRVEAGWDSGTAMAEDLLRQL